MNPTLTSHPEGRPVAPTAPSHLSEEPSAAVAPGRRRMPLALLAVAGVLIPIVFVALVIVAAASYPGYSHVTQFMSQLGVGPSAAITNANFVVTGLLLVAFAFGLHLGIGEGKGSMLGPALLALSGLGWVLAGVFPCSEWTCTATDVHNAVAAPLAFVPIALAPLVFSRRLRADARWRGYASYSVGTGLALVVLMVVYRITEYTLLEPWVGIAQRFLVAVMLLWIGVMALRLLKLSLQETSASERNVRHWDTLRRHAWILLAVAAVGFLLLGLNFVATGAPADRVLFRSIAGQSWEEVATSAPGAAAYLQFIYREFGLVLTAYGAAALSIALTAYRRSERWAWYALWSEPLLLGTLTVMDGAGGASLWLFQTALLFVPLAGLLLPYREVFGQREAEVSEP